MTFLLLACSYTYLVSLLAWWLLRCLFGDRWAWLFIANSFAPYLFLPLPAVVGVAAFVQAPVLLLGSGAALVLWVWIFWRFLPKTATPRFQGLPLTVMSTNLLGWNEHPQHVIAALRTCGADIIGMQELNTVTATAIQQHLIREFPHQQLAARDGDSGMGIISRYPLRPLAATLSGDWIGPPQTVIAELNGTDVVLLNMHAMSPQVTNMAWSVRERERQAIRIHSFIAQRNEPAIVMGDFNATEFSRAYATITRNLYDAWREAGRGFGNTFPGADAEGGSRRIIGGLLAPQWLVRIDYVFYSRHWRADAATIGGWDGVSDHRPIIARLVLLGKT